MRIDNKKDYHTGRHQKGDFGMGIYGERDGILLHPECRPGLYLNAHPTHMAGDEAEYREMAETRDFGPVGRGRRSDRQVE